MRVPDWAFVTANVTVHIKWQQFESAANHGKLQVRLQTAHQNPRHLPREAVKQWARIITHQLFNDVQTPPSRHISIGSVIALVSLKISKCLKQVSSIDSSQRKLLTRSSSSGQN